VGNKARWRVFSVGDVCLQLVGYGTGRKGASSERLRESEKGAEAHEGEKKNA